MTEPKFDGIIQLLAASSAAIGAVEKRERNTQGSGFNFRGIDTVVNATSPEFREHGIIVVPCTIDRVYEQIEVGAKRSLMGHVMLRTQFTFHGPAGDSVTATVDSEAFDSGDKAVAKAMSIGLRTALLQVLMLPTDEPDPDSTTYERTSNAEPESFEGDPGAYVLTFGKKHKGATLLDIDKIDHGYIVWLAGLEDGKPATKAAVAFLASYDPIAAEAAEREPKPEAETSTEVVFDADGNIVW